MTSKTFRKSNQYYTYPNIWNIFPFPSPFHQIRCIFPSVKTSHCGDLELELRRCPTDFAILGRVTPVSWIMISFKMLGWKQQILGILCHAMRRKSELCWSLMMDGPFDTSYLLFCCFFRPTWKKKPQDSQRNKTCKLTTYDLHESLNQPNKTLVFPLDIRTQAHHKRASNGHCGERCTGLPTEKIYNNGLPFGFSQHCGVATGSCNAPAWSWGAVAERKTWGNWSFLWRLRTEFNPLEGSSTLLLGYI